eukprot:tig00020904_g15198.t1
MPRRPSGAATPPLDEELVARVLSDLESGRVSAQELAESIIDPEWPPFEPRVGGDEEAEAAPEDAERPEAPADAFDFDDFAAPLAPTGVPTRRAAARRSTSISPPAAASSSSGPARPRAARRARAVTATREEDVFRELMSERGVPLERTAPPPSTPAPAPAAAGAAAAPVSPHSVSSFVIEPSEDEGDDMEFDT